MKQSPLTTTSPDPIGIVISRGTREEPTPTCAAYVWGPPSGAADESSKAA